MYVCVCMLASYAILLILHHSIPFLNVNPPSRARNTSTCQQRIMPIWSCAQTVKRKKLTKYACVFIWLCGVIGAWFWSLNDFSTFKNSRIQKSCVYNGFVFVFSQNLHFKIPPKSFVIIWDCCLEESSEFLSVELTVQIKIQKLHCIHFKVSKRNLAHTK